MSPNPPPDPQKSPKKARPFEEWPAKRQQAFEAYYAMPGADRSLERVAQMGGYAKFETLRSWSKADGWQAEVERRDRAAADGLRERTRVQRASILDNFEAGVGNLAQSYSMAMSGRCPRCAGAGKRTLRGGVLEDSVCSSCGGSGEFDPLRVNTVAVARLRLLLDGQWSDVRGGSGEEVTGSLTHGEFMALQRQMLEDSGADAAEDVDGHDVPVDGGAS